MKNTLTKLITTVSIGSYKCNFIIVYTCYHVRINFGMDCDDKKFKI